jgi:superfamily II DNA helicase RecQ
VSCSVNGYANYIQLTLYDAELDGLRQRNIEVAALHSQVPHAEQGQVCCFPRNLVSILMYVLKISKQLQDYDTRLKLLYGKLLRRNHRLKYQLGFFTIVTPERMCNQEFMQLLDVVHDNHNLNRLVVDEVCGNPIYY